MAESGNQESNGASTSRARITRIAWITAEIGEVARQTGTRLSFHPGQFTVLASDNDDIVRRSILEVEYHADMARMMGYGRTFQDFKINVHISGKRGPDGVRSAYQKLTPEARNCLTIESKLSRN